MTNAYFTVPAVDEEYTQNLSLHKHRVIRQYAFQSQGDTSLDLLEAKQKIQERVIMGLVSKKSGRRSEIKRKVEKRPQFEKFEAAESKDLGTIILKPAPPPSLSADLPLPEEREKTEGQNLTITDDTTNRTSE